MEKEIKNKLKYLINKKKDLLTICEELEKRRKNAINRNQSDFMKNVCVKRNKERVWSKETLNNMSKRMANNKINSGKKYIHKDGYRKMVLKEELNYYLDNGWILGKGK